MPRNAHSIEKTFYREHFLSRSYSDQIPGDVGMRRRACRGIALIGRFRCSGVVAAEDGVELQSVREVCVY